MKETGFKHIRTEQHDAITLVYFNESQLLEEGLIREIGEEITRLTETDAPRILINFSNIEYLASSMLGKLLTLQRRVQNKSGTFAFCAIPQETYKIFRVSKLDTFFHIYPDTDSALAAIKGAG